MTISAKNNTDYAKLGKKRRESSKRNYYIISPRVIIKAIIITIDLLSPKRDKRDLDNEIND